MALIGSEVVDVPLDQVARVVVQPPGGAAATLSRPDVSADFVTDATLPEGRKLDPVKVESLAGALSGLTMNDVRPSSEITVPPDARRVRFETFAGGAVEVTLTDLGEGETAKHWLTIKVTGRLGEPTDADKPSDQSPAALARKLEGWAFMVPAYQVERLQVGLDQLLAEPSPAS